MGFLLQPISKSSGQQIATEARRRFRAMDLTPSQPQILRSNQPQNAAELRELVDEALRVTSGMS
jgi:hypothetical protein